MGTKNQPGKYDCYNNAKKNEPMFVLLGRDPMAGMLVRIWANYREKLGEDVAKIAEARSCAASMDAYAKKIGKNLVRETISVSHVLFPLFLEELTKAVDVRPSKENPEEQTWTCDHTHAMSSRILEDLGFDVESSLAFFVSRGGYCDCEVMWNVPERTTDRRRRRRRNPLRSKKKITRKNSKKKSSHRAS